MPPSAEVGAYTSIPRWRRQGDSTNGGGVGSGDDDTGSSTSTASSPASASITTSASSETTSSVSASESSTGTDSASSASSPHYIPVDVVLFHFGELTDVNLAPDVFVSPDVVLVILALSDFVLLALVAHHSYIVDIADFDDQDNDHENYRLDQHDFHNFELDNLRHYLKYNHRRW
ncbi:hypothetical protein GY45DRAFT_1375505 [Cubamyces sp. BRFM 1775]|nr:hypothetical protein GY45DRAFT_1375505 [Cubamyces sp. BRFM 1775]